ncbi:hypothetical protein [Pyrococcus kukulkanii]|uniref:Uncharacterized protein n=1 Tax=Pyrococcus kukulkanii TaxID=1609559 RepID=A0ABV4T6T4_9EURY
MSEEPEIQQVYQYSVWYDIWLTIKKWAPRVVAGIIALYILRYVVIHAPTWLSMTVIGFIIALPIAYIFVSRFFSVDYYVVLDVDLERRTITPYYFPVKLFLDGKWEIAGIKASFSEDIKFSGLDSDLDAINDEIKKIDEELEELEKEKKEVLRLLAEAKRQKEQKKKEKERYEEYSLLKSKEEQLLARFDMLKKRLLEETNPLQQRKINYELAKVEKEFEQIQKELSKFPHPPEEISETLIEEITLSIVELKKELVEIEDEIAELRAKKNRIFDQFSIISDDGMKIFVADEIDWQNKRIILAPIHGYSDLELILNKKRFKEFKEKVNKIFEEYAKMKVKYDQQALDKAIELIESLDFEDELIEDLLKQSKEEREKVDELI